MTDTTETVSYLDVTPQQTESGIVLQVQGDLDLLTVTKLDDAVEDAIDILSKEPSGWKLTLDLKELDFIDSAGLALLIRITRELAVIEGVLTVVVSNGRQPDRVLKIGQFNRILDLVSE